MLAPAASSNSRASGDAGSEGSDRDERRRARLERVAPHNYEELMAELHSTDVEP